MTRNKLILTHQTAKNLHRDMSIDSRVSPKYTKAVEMIKDNIQWLLDNF